jgi:hypothetical protein
VRKLGVQSEGRVMRRFRDLIRSLPVRSTFGLPVCVAAAQPLHSRLRSE